MIIFMLLSKHTKEKTCNLDYPLRTKIMLMQIQKLCIPPYFCFSLGAEKLLLSSGFRLSSSIRRTSLITDQVPGSVLLVLDKMMKAQTTESEKTETHVFSVYISMASVNENRVLLSAQLRSLSASAA